MDCRRLPYPTFIAKVSGALAPFGLAADSAGPYQRR